ncbi:hypothetical protein ACS0TY_002504 [Phlomoides rotata]
MEDEEVLELGNGGTGLARRLCAELVCLVGRICTEKSVNSFALMDVLIKAFHAKGKLSARDWGHGLLIFNFELKEDRDWVLRNQPWHFDNALFAIKPLSGKEQPSRNKGGMSQIIYLDNVGAHPPCVKQAGIDPCPSPEVIEEDNPVPSHKKFS